MAYSSLRIGRSCNPFFGPARINPFFGVCLAVELATDLLPFIVIGVVIDHDPSTSTPTVSIIALAGSAVATSLRSYIHDLSSCFAIRNALPDRIFKFDHRTAFGDDKAGTTTAAPL